MGFGLALIGRIKAWVFVAGAVLVGIVAAYWRGRSDANADAHERELNEYVETRRRIDESTMPNDAHAAREWLRKRAERDGDL